MASITIVHLLSYYAVCYAAWIFAVAHVPFEKIAIVTGIAFFFCSLPTIYILHTLGTP